MDLRGAVRYLDYMLKKEAEESLFRIVTAQSLALLSSGHRTKELVNYQEIVTEIYSPQKHKQEKSAAEIIAETAERFGVKVV